MEFKRILIIVTLAIIATSLIATSCSPDNQIEPSSEYNPHTASIEQDHDSGFFYGSFLGSWLGTHLGGNNSYDTYRRNYNTNNNSVKTTDIKQPNSTNIRTKSSISPDKTIVNIKQSVSNKTGIGTGGLRSGSISKAAS